MTMPSYTILLVNPDARTRARLEQQLASPRCTLLHAESGEHAFKIISERDVRLVVTELYLKTGEHADLIQAIRHTKGMRRTRTLAHTAYSASVDREWALNVGADGYLIRPTLTQRLRHVVSRLVVSRQSKSSSPGKSGSSRKGREVAPERHAGPYRADSV